MQSSSAQASTNTPPATHRVIELFAGVGGFHFGLEQANQLRKAQGLPRAFTVVYANQWEPTGKHQHAARVYEARFGLKPVCRDLMKVLDDSAEMARIHELAPTVLVGGFPCQDYSVAKPSSQSEGIEGKKGVLWWGIHRMLEARIAAGQPVQQVLLENVDRLITSPASCPGRDFAIILASLQSLGYAVSWQVVNSAEYGFAQRRKRLFIWAVHESTPQFEHMQADCTGNLSKLLVEATPQARSLPVSLEGAVSTFALGADVYETQISYQPDSRKKSLFANAGVCIGGQVFTGKVTALTPVDCTAFTGSASPLTLGDVIAKTEEVPESFYISDAAIAQWEYAKGSKRIARVSATGHAYNFSEGSMAFPDALDRASRTIITGEGGVSASRTKHAVLGTDARLRRLTPEELEELNGFPRGFTKLDGVNDIARARLMGNALITGVVACIASAMVDSVPAPTPVPVTERVIESGSETRREDMVVHAVGWTLMSFDHGEPMEWLAGVTVNGKLSCRVFIRATQVSSGLSYGIRRIDFRNMAKLEEDLAYELGKLKLPRRVVDALLEAVPDFILNAEVAYHTHNYFYRPSE